MRRNERRGGKAKYIVGIVLALVLASVVGYALWTSSTSLRKFDVVLEPYTTLTVRETFALGLKSFTVQVTPFGPTRIVGFDELKARYAAYFDRNNALVIEVNDRKVDDAMQQYQSIYVRALYSLVESNAPVEVAPADQKLLFEALHNMAVEYARDDSGEALIVKGITQEGREIALFFSPRRMKNEFRLSVRKIVLDGRELTDRERMVVLSRIYKKDIEQDPLTLVKMGAINGFRKLTVEQLFGKFENVSWYIKDEKQGLVEVTFTGQVKEIHPKPAAFALGLKIDQYGEVTPEYLVVNGSEVQPSQVRSYVSFILSKVSEEFESFEKERIVELIRKGEIAEIKTTLGQFLDQNFDEPSWSVALSLTGARVKFAGRLKKDGSKVAMNFDFSGNEAKLLQTEKNGRVVLAEELFKEILAMPVGTPITPVASPTEDTDELSESEKSLKLVKNSKLVPSSPFGSNDEAFRNSLSQIKWSYDPEHKRVVLTGVGTYLSKRRNLSFTFSLEGPSPVLTRVLLDGQSAKEVVTRYLVGKIFRMPGYEKEIIEFVKNSIGSRKTLRQSIGETGWSVDPKTDLVVVRKDKLQIQFAVEASGDVLLSKLFYAGKDYTGRSAEVLMLLEEGRDLATLEKPSTPEPVSTTKPEKPASVTREATKIENLSRTPTSLTRDTKQDLDQKMPETKMPTRTEQPKKSTEPEQPSDFEGETTSPIYEPPVEEVPEPPTTEVTPPEHGNF